MAAGMVDQCAVVEVGADDPVRGQREQQDQRDAEEGAGADRGETEHVAEADTDDDGDDLEAAMLSGPVASLRLVDRGA